MEKSIIHFTCPLTRLCTLGLAIAARDAGDREQLPPFDSDASVQLSRWTQRRLGQYSDASKKFDDIFISTRANNELQGWHKGHDFYFRVSLEPGSDYIVRLLVCDDAAGKPHPDIEGLKADIAALLDE